MGVRVLAAILVLTTAGCTHQQEAGTESSARHFFNGEFQKWIAGKETEVSTMKSRIGTFQNPISYDIRSVVPDKPDLLAIAQDYDRKGESSEDEGEWTAWKFNVAIEWKSQAGTPMEKVATYTLTWNPHEKKWVVSER